MDDLILISRAAAIAAITEIQLDPEVGQMIWSSDAKWAISALPTVDAVQVVRCADCKYWQDNNGGYPNDNCRWGHDETPDPDDYCSYGERRANDG